jgi:multiple sugar transport system permease protein
VDAMQTDTQSTPRSSVFDKLFHLVGSTAATVYVLTLLVPLAFVLISAFKEHSAIVLHPMALPKSFDFGNFVRAAERAGLVDAMYHTAIIVVFTELVNLVLSYLAAYGIARIKIFETTVVESIFGAGFLIPAFALMLPIFLLAADLGVLYEPAYLIVFYAASRIPFSVIILASAMRCIPQDFEDSAKIDGANLLQIIRHIFLPLTRSALITIVVVNLLHVWNEYLFALILLPARFFTIQLALPLLKGEHSVDFALMSAGVVISLIPVYIFFVIFQEQIVKGLTVGGVEG